ncbi:MAG: hypothetical protein HY826_05845 [Actinobacteria bacterium]|nr:hypothetical protein [Actinomycetota bacterium]
MTVVVCLKWVHDAAQPDDVRFGAMSPADHSALELALQCGEWAHADVTAITVGPAQADHILRDALACGVRRAVRIETSHAVSGADVAAAIAAVVADAHWVWCGDYSIDNGSGSVPAFLAAALAARQALGVIHLSFGDAPTIDAGVIEATRRLDGGRREVLEVRAPAVVSVEGATAHLRRAGLTALRTAAAAAIEVIRIATPTRVDDCVVQQYRPRARELAGPDGVSALARVLSLTGAGGARGAASARRTVVLDPLDAAGRILTELREWGYRT